MSQGRRVVNGGLRGERVPQTTESVVRQGLFEGLLSMLFNIANNYTAELVLVLVPVTLWIAIEGYISWVIATASTLVMVLAVDLFGPSRRFVFGQLHRSSMQRRWTKAARFAGLVTMNDHVPSIRRMKRTPVGDRLLVRIPSGSAFSQIESACERLATCLEVREVRVEKDRSNARYATVDVVRRDPFLETNITAWPNLDASQLFLWEPIPVGINEFGEVVYVLLPERNLLIGGEPGAGKSVGLSQLVATAALDPSCDLTLLDGKRVELAPWRHCAANVVGPSVKDACAVLADIQTEIDHRYDFLVDGGKRKIDKDSDMALHVVVCDELAFYLTMGDRKDNQEFERLARDIVARGRAAGVIFLAATQRPSHDIVPTSLRDLFAFRWALRCTTPQASDTILGQGWASQGYSAHEIDAAAKGVGLLRHEGDLPTRIRSFWLSDDDIDSLARRATTLRNPPRDLASVA